MVNGEVSSWCIWWDNDQEGGLAILLLWYGYAGDKSQHWPYLRLHDLYTNAEEWLF
jgi:hypothetical protein